MSRRGPAVAGAVADAGAASVVTAGPGGRCRQGWERGVPVRLDAS
ncbi:hypothetical protein ACNTMW_18650 [Planosporangium sp. 12N6]